METKVLLRLIKEDIAHLQGIAGDFNPESLPGIDEVELALVKAGALLRQLELLHKALDKTVGHSSNLIVSDHSQVEGLEIEVDEAKEALFSGTADHKPLPNPVGIEKPVLPVGQETKAVLESATLPKDHIPENRNMVEDSDTPENDGGKERTGGASAETLQIANDLFSQEKSESGYHFIPIHSMWDGIGINDRFLFVRELFENDSAKFELAVNALNQLSTIQEAVNYLKLSFKWHKTEASQKFLVLVKRRFTK